MDDHEFHSAWIVGDEPLRTSGAASALFPWWSFTKTVLAVCVLRLWEQERLDLHERLPGRPFTLHQLLQNRAGVPDYGRLQSYHEAVTRGDAPWSRDELWERVQANRLDFAPGTGWSYSNVGFLLVRELIETRTAQDLGATISALVTRPVGLTSVRLASSASDFADVHWEAMRDYDPRWVYRGCLIGTPGEACRFLHALLAGQLLRPETLDLMLERHHLGGGVSGRPWTSQGYALGLMSGAMGSAGRAIGHSGGGPGCGNAVYHFPDLARPVTVASFTDGHDEGRAEFKALRIALRLGNQGHSQNSTTAARAQAERKLVAPERTIYKVNGVLGLAEAIEAGIGVGHLRCFVGDARSGLMRLRDPQPDFAADLWLLTHPDLRQSARVRVFLDFLAGEIKQQRGLIEGVIERDPQAT